MEEKEEAITIEFPLDKLVKGANAGHYVHRQHHEDRWCMRYGDTQRTRSYDRFGKTDEERNGKTTHLSITEDEIEKHIVIARREAKNSVARLQNLEKLQLELCLRRQNQPDPMANGSDRGEEACPVCGISSEPGDALHHGFRCGCWQR